jgi:hypothetical protein
MPLVERYLGQLTPRLTKSDQDELALAHGASERDIERLIKRYPDCPSSLLALLRRIDGTYHRKYPKGTVAVLILGSDVLEYPCYLKSVNQILGGGKVQKSIADIWGDVLDEVKIDPAVDVALPQGNRLCFSDCMNNGEGAIRKRTAPCIYADSRRLGADPGFAS